MRSMVEDSQEDINFFKYNYWFYDAREMTGLVEKMDASDADEFLCDPRKVDFANEGAMLMYGIQRYYMNQDVPVQGSGIRQIV